MGEKGYLNILAESDDEEEEDERTDHSYAKEKSNSVVIEQHGASGKEILESSTIIASRSLHEPLAVVRSQPPTLIMASQPLSSQQNSIQPKQEPETEPLSVAPTLEAGHRDPFLDSVLTDSDDDDEGEREKEDESNSRRTTSNPTGAIDNIDVALIDSSHAPISNDNRSESQTTEVIAPVVRKQSPTVIVAKPTQESVPIKKEISISSEPSSAEAYHDPFLNGVFTDSEDEEDDDEKEQNIPDKLHNELPDIIVSSEIPYPSTTKDTVSTPIETEHLETTQSANVESNTQSQTHSINSCFNRHSDNTNAAEVAQTQLQPSESETQSITNLTELLSSPDPSIASVTALQYSGVDRLGIQALDNSLKSVPRHFIVKQRLPPTVPVDPPINRLIEQPNIDSGETEVQGVTNKDQMIQPPLRSESSRIEDLAEDSEPFEHSYQSPDSNRLFIAWSPSSATNSSGLWRTSRAPEPPTASSPTASKFQAEQYDSIQPSIESRLRFQIVLRSLWPTLFARDDSFCDFLHLISVLAQNIFPLLQPNTGHAAMALLRMVTPIASRLAYGSFELTENDNLRSLTETNDRNQITNRTDDERETSKRQSGTQSNLNTDETPSLVISDDDEEGELLVRLKRHYRVHQLAPSHTD
ncbi:AAEL002712-PA [Aedes aegypti]|uniref:AAEL002712-PA n=1 Tax=Aedes aegypti TaxID=7159 RepID=Q17HD2_AEDAE|nr:AAEL002712-PA [Aedes aegypti]